MIEVEIDSMEENIDQRLQYQGLNLEQYMKILGKTKKELRDEFKEEAEKNVKYKLVIDAIVKAEKIKADKKFIKEEVENMSKQYGKDVKEIESRKDIMDYLEQASKVEIPAGMIEVEIDSMEDNMNQRLQYQGLNLEQYMKILGKTKKELRDELKVEAEKNVKYKLVIDAIVKAEKIKADKKFIKEEIENIAKQYGQDAKEIESRKDIIEYLENASKNSQAVKFIIDNAKISK